MNYTDQMRIPGSLAFEEVKRNITRAVSIPASRVASSAGNASSAIGSLGTKKVRMGEGERNPLPLARFLVPIACGGG